MARWQSIPKTPLQRYLENFKFEDVWGGWRTEKNNSSPLNYVFFFLPGDILNVYFFLEYFWIVFLVVVPAIFGIVEGFW